MLRPQGCSPQGLDLHLSSLDLGRVSQELSGAVHSSSSSPQDAEAASLQCSVGLFLTQSTATFVPSVWGLGAG